MAFPRHLHVMDDHRQLGPPRLQQNSGGQLNSLVNGLPPPGSTGNNFPIRHPSQHMQINGPLSRQAPPGMTVSGGGGQQPQQTITINNPSALQPGTVYLIRSPTGELQLVRLQHTPGPGPNLPPQIGGNNGQPRPGLPNQQMNTVRFPAPTTLGVPNQQPQQQQGHMNNMSMQGPQGSINIPSGLGGLSQQQSHMGNHHPNSMPQGMHPQMPPQGMQQRPVLPPPQQQNAPPHGPTKTVDDALAKARQFFNALLSMSKTQSETMYETARDLLQQLVDAKINPDMFARRLQEELKSTPQPILAPLLKACLFELRKGLATGEISIEGINAPPQSVLNIVDPNATTININPAQFSLPQMPIKQEPPSQSPAPKPKGGKKAAKNVPPVESPNLSEQHPVFSQLPQLQAHPKVEKVKATKPPVEKKITAKQRKQQQQAEQKAKLDQEIANSAPTSTKEPKELKEQKTDEDELNDVAAMGGVNLNEENAKLSSADIVGTQTRSIDDQSVLPGDSVRRRINVAAKGLVQDDIPSDVLTLISHAIEARIRNCCERLNVIAEHRSESVRGHAHYKPTQDIRGQLKFIEELDKVEKRKREEEEKETLLRAAKSRNRPEDPEHMKLKQKAKELQRVQQEEQRTQEANQAALAALVGGPRKKPRLDAGADGAMAGPSVAGASKTDVKSQPYRPRIKRASLRDVVFMMETDGKMSKSPLLYQILHQIK